MLNKLNLGALGNKARSLAASTVESAKNIDLDKVKNVAASVAAKAKKLDVATIKNAATDAASKARELASGALPAASADDGTPLTTDAQISSVAAQLATLGKSIGQMSGELDSIAKMIASQPKPAKPGSRILVVVSGGNVQVKFDADVDCMIYNFDDHEVNTATGGVPERFRDLAEEFGVPVAEGAGSASE